MKTNFFKSALLALLCAVLFAGCVRIELPVPEPQTVYASFYPIYALAAGVCENVPGLTLSCLTQPQDGCLRSYSLSDWDAALLSGADMLIMSGRGLENWEETLEGGALPVLKAAEGLHLLGEEEQMTDESGHFEGTNPWAFLSVQGARGMTAAIAAGMSALDPDYAAIYAENLAAMEKRFDALSADMRSALSGIDLPGMILMQEGLAYFARDIGAVSYIEIEREAGSDMSDIEFADALEKMSASGYSLVLIEKQAPQGLIKALENEGYTVVLIDILTDHSESEGADGYFSAMLRSTQALAAALE